MPQNTGKSRLSQEQTKRLLDDYMQYRFRQSFSADELAKRAGVKVEVVHGLVQQQPVDEEGIGRVADALGVSSRFLRGICGLEEISAELLRTIESFMAQTLRPKARETGA